MTYELTNEEKSKVVETRLKSLEYSIYNVNLSKREENAKSTPRSSCGLQHSASRF